MLKSCRKLSNSEDTISSISTPLASDVRLVPQGSGDSVYDITRSPLVDFHHCERLQQESSQQGDLNAIDFILISWTLKINTDPGFCNAPHLISHHSFHCSVASAAPISWLVEGPGTLHHNFSSFCEVKLKMTIYNSSGAITFVRMKTFNSSSNVGLLTGVNAIQSATPGNQAGWHDVSLVNDIKVASNIPGTQLGKPLSLESVCPFIWSGPSSTNVQIEPKSSVEIPLQVCVISPGTYDLSNYVLNWNLSPSNGRGNHEEGRQASGTCQGYPYYITLLQSA